MNVKIEAKPAFAFLRVELAPGETIIAEADAMSTMSAELDMTAKFNGGLLNGLIKKFLGGESLFVNHFTEQYLPNVEFDFSSSDSWRHGV